MIPDTRRDGQLMNALVSPWGVQDFEAREVVPARELGAYEALWARQGTSFKSLADLFRQSPDALPSDFVPAAEAREYARLALSALREAQLRRFGIRVYGAGEYPPGLRDAQHPLELIYFQGNWDLASSRSVALIGTRQPSIEGTRSATALARQCAAAGFTVVSGLARGIDTVVHQAAIAAGGRTIAVLGTPVTSCYPQENAGLQRRIAEQFLLISQVPVMRYARQDWQHNRLFLHERTVTMAALTEATIIVEAGNTSSALIQARHALLQGRKLFVLDSCVRNPALSWPAQLLERGAISVAGFEQIRVHLAP
jgi:DNA processing protein